MQDASCDMSYDLCSSYIHRTIRVNTEATCCERYKRCAKFLAAAYGRLRKRAVLLMKAVPRIRATMCHAVYDYV